MRFACFADFLPSANFVLICKLRKLFLEKSHFVISFLRFGPFYFLFFKKIL